MREQLRRIIREEVENLDWISNFVNPKSMEDYITLYNFRVDRAIEDYKEMYGEEPNDSWEVISGDGDFTVEEVVGWYLQSYNNFYEQWLENTKGLPMSRKDIEVTKILKSFSEEEEEIIDEDGSMWDNDELWGTEDSHWGNDPMWGSSDGGYTGDSGGNDDGGDDFG